LRIEDVDGTSDPFVAYNFCGRQVACTRVRPRTLNPRWDNETFIVPLDMLNTSSKASEAGLLPSQRNIVKLEAFDHDWISQNDFLGHVELSVEQLEAMAASAEGRAVQLPLSDKESHGLLHLRLGYTSSCASPVAGEEAEEPAVYVALQRAENLDKIDTVHLSSPFGKVFSCVPDGEAERSPSCERLVGSTAAQPETIHPDWQAAAEQFNEGQWVFRLCSLRSLLALEQSRRDEAAAEELLPVAEDPEQRSHDQQLFRELQQGGAREAASPAVARIELHSRHRMSSLPLGEVALSLAQLRALLPDLPFSLYEACSLPPSPSNPSAAPAPTGLPSPGLDGVPRWLRFCLQLLPPGITGGLAGPEEAEGEPLRETQRGRPSKQRNWLSDPSLTWSGPCALPVLQQARAASHSPSTPPAASSLLVRLLPATRGEAVQALDVALRQMSLGERALLKCRYDSLYGNYCMGASLPPRSNMLVKVELLQINGKGLWAQRHPLRQLLVRTLRRAAKLWGWIRTRVLLPVMPQGWKGLVKGRKGRKRRGSEGGWGSGWWGKQGLEEGPLQEEEEEDWQEEEDEEEEQEEDEEEDEEEEEEEESDEGGGEERLRVDPRLRDHLTPAALIGSRLLWSGSRSRPLKKAQRAKKRVQQSSLEVYEESERGEDDGDVVDGGDEEGLRDNLT